MESQTTQSFHALYFTSETGEKYTSAFMSLFLEMVPSEKVLYRKKTRSYGVSTYTPYGKMNELAVSAASNNNDVTQKFTGKELDEGIELSYFGARYYDADLAMWTSTDPLREYHDLYNYVGGDPINNTDPTGMSSQLVKFGGKILRNGHLAGKKHPMTGIPFTSQGFADFSGVAIESIDIGKFVNRAADAKKANQIAGFKKTPAGYVWHHVEDGKTMQLVPKDVHSKTGHTGGHALKSGGAATTMGGLGTIISILWSFINPNPISAEDAAAVVGPPDAMDFDDVSDEEFE